jgi:hypothetical protein
MDLHSMCTLFLVPLVFARVVSLERLLSGRRSSCETLTWARMAHTGTHTDPIARARQRVDNVSNGSSIDIRKVPCASFVTERL